jgi:hypothetical protein
MVRTDELKEKNLSQRQILGAFAKLGKTTINLGMSVRRQANNSAPTARIFMKF